MTKKKLVEKLRTNLHANLEIYTQHIEGKAQTYRGDGTRMSKEEALADTGATIRTLSYVIQLLEGGVK